MELQEHPYKKNWKLSQEGTKNLKSSFENAVVKRDQAEIDNDNRAVVEWMLQVVNYARRLLIKDADLQHFPNYFNYLIETLVNFYPLHYEEATQKERIEQFSSVSELANIFDVYRDYLQTLVVVSKIYPGFAPLFSQFKEVVLQELKNGSRFNEFEDQHLSRRAKIVEIQFGTGEELLEAYSNYCQLVAEENQSYEEFISVSAIAFGNCNPLIYPDIYFNLIVQFQTKNGYFRATQENLGVDNKFLLKSFAKEQFPKAQGVGTRLLLRRRHKKVVKAGSLRVENASVDEDEPSPSVFNQAELNEFQKIVEHFITSSQE